MQARFPFFRQKTALAAREGCGDKYYPGGRSRTARSRRHSIHEPTPTAMRLAAGASGAICGAGWVNERIGPFRAPEGVFRRIRGHGRARGQKECVRRRFSGGRRLFVRFRTDWRIRRSRSSWCRRRGRVQPTCSDRRWSSSRAYRWRTDGRGGRPSGHCCNRRRPR